MLTPRTSYFFVVCGRWGVGIVPDYSTFHCSRFDSFLLAFTFVPKASNTNCFGNIFVWKPLDSAICDSVGIFCIRSHRKWVRNLHTLKCMNSLFILLEPGSKTFIECENKCQSCISSFLNFQNFSVKNQKKFSSYFSCIQVFKFWMANRFWCHVRTLKFLIGFPPNEKKKK